MRYVRNAIAPPSWISSRWAAVLSVTSCALSTVAPFHVDGCMPLPNGGIVRHLVKVNCLFLVIALGAIAPRPASAQRYFYKTTTLKIIGTDSVPVPFAVITVDGEPRIANEKGELDIGKATDKTMELEIRRIGYAPLVGTVVFPDSETLKVLMLARISRNLSPVVVNASSASAALES